MMMIMIVILLDKTVFDRFHLLTGLSQSTALQRIQLLHGSTIRCEWSGQYLGMCAVGILFQFYQQLSVQPEKM